MKIIKLIDLLIKIANGEELPKKIKFCSRIFEYNGIDYLCIDKIRYLKGDFYTNHSIDKWISVNCLNDEVEILEEEKKIPEKIKSNGKEFYCDNIDSWIDKEKTSAYCEYLMNKYNDLIDYLKNKGE